MPKHQTICLTKLISLTPQIKIFFKLVKQIKIKNIIEKYQKEKNIPNFTHGNSTGEAPI